MSKVIVYNKTKKYLDNYLLQLASRTLIKFEGDNKKTDLLTEWGDGKIFSYAKRNKSGISITFWEEENEN